MHLPPVDYLCGPWKWFESTVAVMLSCGFEMPKAQRVILNGPVSFEEGF
jgi:hypothetical protein